MDIRQFSYFMAVAQEGGYSRAAQRLGVSQPTLSIAIKKLEEELGAKLFYTFDRRQRLTEEGQRLMEGSRQLLDLYRKTLEDVREAGRENQGSFTLGLSPLFGACFFGGLLPSFHEQYPDIRISMIEDGANKIDELVERGEIDIAVTLNTERLASFESCHFTTQRNVALVHKSHPLAGEKTMTVAQLRDEPFAIFNEDFILHRQIVSACQAAGFRPQFVLLSSQWDFMVDIVSQNRGVSILPKPVMDKHPDPNVCCIPMVDSMKYWDISLAWNRQKYMPRACRTFLEFVKRHLPPDDL